MPGVDRLSAEEVARLLDLAPHPEGGFYRETFRDPRQIDGRSVGTAIYYLLPAGQVSAWHRVDAGEIWHWHAGAPLALSLCEDGGRVTTLRLGPDLAGGERPQRIAPAGVWQSARSLGAWTLVGCTVAPGFEFAHFELAPPDFSPPG
ncbi:cupin domain-containing protein [Methylocystis parvus]|uniref:Cupin domain-containing protein n=1 Tax=Methylocystis parvus TaxID=134 RepID=A0A6B8M1A8_9HYPH|nr:cupin domain-containing protein [Methylocystis parvus]QGM96651.1 cupin domain-containing protein [Methylocystis parvus]WBJ99491.1 cupin domain-containing protein [Methylocystis parvus OBBP]